MTISIQFPRPTTDQDDTKAATRVAPSLVTAIHEQFSNDETGEVRVVSSSGGAKGMKPARFDQIPTDFLFELAEQYGKGNGKYEAVNGLDNWRNGYPWHLSFGAAMRHLVAAMGGEDIDAETGTKHVIAVAWHMSVLTHWMNNPAMEAFDDRQDVLDRKPVAA